MKYVYALFLALSLTGCLEPATPEEKELQRVERLKKAERRIDQLKQQASACDKNDGIKDIPPPVCGRGGCSDTIIVCNDGMERHFDTIR